MKDQPHGVKYEIASFGYDDKHNNNKATTNVQSNVISSSNMESNPNVVRAGDFLIDLDIISKQSLIKMRRLLPKQEYKMIKNRKCARLTR